MALVFALCAPAAARADEALLAGPDDPGVEEDLEQVGDPEDEGAAPVGEEPRGSELADVLDAYLAENAPATGVPGVAVAVVDPDGVRYQATLGDCPDAHETFLLGSLSKSVTAVAVMQLVEEGRIDLDTPVVNYVGTAADLPDAVTVRSLLNQTSGFGYYESLADARVGESAGSFSYANANYDLLGRLVEAVSGQSLDSYLQESVFGPLGMADASADLAATPTVPGYRSWFGVPVADGFRHEEGDDAWGGPASGYVSASLADMEAYLRMYLNSGVVVGGAAADGGALADDGAPADGRSAGVADSITPTASVLSPDGVHQMVFSRVPDPAGDTWYGMGWTTYTWGDGELVMSHDGQVENYVARMCVIPGRNLGVVVLGDANDEFGGNEAFFSLADDIVSIAVGAEPAGVDGAARLSEHVSYDVLYLVAVVACVVPLVRARRWHGRLIPAVILHVVAPAWLLGVPMAATGMRWQDFADFYPDQTLVLVVCCVLLVASGAAKLLAWRRRSTATIAASPAA
ncbi:serine hydrolase domain-containing protein [Olsenella profusa]|uniref:serine hydrolase domain-containing protein n=1 Tax=Olsenella profusa TaxID=138595 RepID=UPI00315A0801